VVATRPTNESAGFGAGDAEPVGAEGRNVAADGLGSADVGEVEGEVDGWTSSELHATSVSVASSEAARTRRDIFDSVSGGG
jgi:hypothetical protein